MLADWWKMVTWRQFLPFFFFPLCSWCGDGIRLLLSAELDQKSKMNQYGAPAYLEHRPTFWNIKKLETILTREKKKKKCFGAVPGLLELQAGVLRSPFPGVGNEIWQAITATCFHIITTSLSFVLALTGGQEAFSFQPGLVDKKLALALSLKNWQNLTKKSWSSRKFSLRMTHLPLEIFAQNTSKFNTPFFFFFFPVQRREEKCS